MSKSYKAAKSSMHMFVKYGTCGNSAKIIRQLCYSAPRIASYINSDCPSVALNLGKERLFSDFCIRLNCMCILAWNSMKRIMA